VAFSIAQVTPWPWEQHHEVNRFVERLSDELCARGHRTVVIAPSDSRELVREGRAKVEEMRSDGEVLWAEPGCATVVAVGQSLPFRRGGSLSLPLDVSRTLEDLLDRVELDFVQVHEPFAPSAASAALRHSRALNVGTFHSTTERFISTQVARKVVERLLGRLDGRTASSAATRDLMQRYFPGDYRVIPPGADLLPRSAPADGVPRSSSPPRRSAGRCGCFCVRFAGCRSTSTGGRRFGCAYPRRHPRSACRGAYANE
jgi:Glycosyltransferase Family 4